MSWFLAFAGFAVLIILHEFGHFLAAKRVGMRVERFFLFFPPKLFSIKRGETEYGVGAIPAGGFVKITGMNPDEVHPELDPPKPGEPPREPLPPDVVERAYYNQPVWKRIMVIAAGPGMNFLIAFLILFGLAFGAKEVSGPGLGVGQVVAGSPAEGKLKVDDKLVSVDGVTARGLNADDRALKLRKQIETHQCAGQPSDGCMGQTPAKFVVERDGRRMPLAITPEYDAAAGRMLVGLGFQAADLAPVDPSPPQAAGRAADQMWFVTSQTLTIFSKIFDSEQRKQLSGAVGSYEVTRQAIDTDARTALTLLAIISLSLAIINLFPFLPLDGGHIFWSLVEKVRGRPVPFSVMERAGVVGFALVLMLFFIGLSNDIGRLSGEGFSVR
ncbi:MAG: RIP metalloprotease [Solirubrobacterales bacterium]|nr:RIP metalloprotease [Solirubrobacterales bacterium]